MKKLAIMISGNGSNMRAILNAKLPIDKIIVISSNTKAGGIKIAKNHGIETIILNYDSYSNKTQYNNALGNMLEDFDPDLIALAGYMKILPSKIIEQFKNKIINIHPSLLPEFKGLNPHQRAIDAESQYHGCTVHVVTEQLDSGSILGQTKVPIYPDDTAEELAKRVLIEEHILYPTIIKSLIT